MTAPDSKQNLPISLELAVSTRAPSFAPVEVASSTYGIAPTITFVRNRSLSADLAQCIHIVLFLRIARRGRDRLVTYLLGHSCSCFGRMPSTGSAQMQPFRSGKQCGSTCWNGARPVG